MTTVTLILIVVDPLAEVALAVQRKDGSLLPPDAVSPTAIRFSVEIDVVQNEVRVDFRGPCVSGPRDDRFIYISSGKRVGPLSSPWDRRAKLKLQGITRELLCGLEGMPQPALLGRFAGRAKDGGPFCASVQPLAPGWTVAPG